MSQHYFQTKNYAGRNNKVVSYTDGLLHNAKELVLSRSWQPLVILARTTIVSLMERITHGELKIYTTDGIWTFGQPKVTKPFPGLDLENGELRAEIKVVNDSFWLRMLVLCDLGFAESYMARDIEVDSLENVFMMFILNRSNLTELDTSASTVFASLNYLMNSRFVNSLSNAISNISAHYDISNTMFESFLSRDMTYSCAIFDQKDDNPAKDDIQDPLEAAQLRKMNRILDNSQVEPGFRILEIGSGWGGLAIEAAKRGCTVDTITLSVEQQELARQRIEHAGYSSKITVHLMDYRKMPEDWMGAFDRVVSVEMIEAVGLEYMEGYFEAFTWALKPETGMGVYQVITMPEARFERYRYEIDFIRKYIFPGGVLPSITFLTQAMTKGSNGKLVTEAIENIGPHYTRTLREWEQRFARRFESQIVPALKDAYPELQTAHDVEVFRRKWIYYFEYCAAGFALHQINDHIFTVRKQ